MDQLPLGRVAGGPHGVVLSLPTLRDVIGYETADPRVARAVTHGYPRFVAHADVRRLLVAIAARLDNDGGAGGPDGAVLCAVTSAAVGARLAAFARCTRACGRAPDGSGGSRVIDCSKIAASGPALRRMAVVALPRCTCTVEAAKAFQQHTGARVGSRQAADALAELGEGGACEAASGRLGDGVACGDVCATDAAERCGADADAGNDVRRALAALLHAPLTDVHLASCGAAAIAAAHDLVGRVWADRLMGHRLRVFGAPHSPSESVADAPPPPAPAPLRRGARDRSVWVQLGWLYVDTTELLRRFDGRVAGGVAGGVGDDSGANDDGADAAAAVAAAVDAAVAECGGCRGRSVAVLSASAVALYDVTDAALLAALLRHLGPAAAGVVTECPTNPLVQTADLPLLRVVTAAAGVPLIIDATVGGPGTLRLLPHCDVLVSSTTKFVGSCGDVMGGVLVVGGGGGNGGAVDDDNAARGAAAEGGQHGSGAPWGPALRRQLQLDPVAVEPPYIRDLDVLRLGLAQLPTVLPALHAGTAAVAGWLSTLVCSSADDDGDLEGGGDDGSCGGGGVPWAVAPLRAVHWAYASAASPPSAARSSGTSGSRGGSDRSGDVGSGPAAAVPASHALAPAAPAHCFRALSDASPGAALTPGCIVTFELRGTWFNGARRRRRSAATTPSLPTSGAGAAVGVDNEAETETDAEAESAHHVRAESLLAAFYDAVGLIDAGAPTSAPTPPPPRGIVKGPSFGTTFAVLAPFMYLAHYDLVRDRAGRARMYAAGLNPYLLRLSVGCEPPAAIADALRAGFRAAAAVAAGGAREGTPLALAAETHERLEAASHLVP